VKVERSSETTYTTLSNKPSVLMMRLRKILIFAVLIIFALLCLVACGDGPGPDPDPPENNAPTASANANTTSAIVGDTIQLDASGSSDPDDDKLSFSWTLDRPSGSNTTLSSPTAVDPWFVPDTATTSNEDYSAEVTVTEDTEDGLSDTDQATVTAQKQLPQTVTVPFENVAADGDSLITGTVTWKDSVVAEDVRSAEVEIPASRDTGELCVQESDLFAEGCKTLTPTSDISEMQVISVQRKTVEFTVVPDPPYGDPQDTDVTVYEPFGADSTKFTGESTVELAKRKASLNRQVKTDLITDDPEKDGHLDRLTADTTAAANSDVELSAQPTLLPACSDGIDNEGDGLVDADEPGCAERDGSGYDPEDDNETHSIVQITVGKFYDDSTYVSSKEGNRSAQIRGATNPLPQSVTVAVSEIFFAIEAKRSVDVTGQEFAIHIKSGDDNDNLTVEKTSDVVADPDTTDGWSVFVVNGIDRTFFANGPHYSVFAWHGTKALDQPPGGGNDWLVLYEEAENSRTYLIEYYYEPDHPDLQDENSKVAGISTTPESGKCRKLPKGRICTNMAIKDLPPLVR